MAKFRCKVNLLNNALLKIILSETERKKLVMNTKPTPR